MRDICGFTIREFVADDYDRAFALWSRTEGLSLNEADSREAVAAFLERNPGCSAVATNEDGEMVGALLCGHNGRAGSLNHLAVAQECRGKGLGRSLVEFCIAKLALARVARCNIFVYSDNETGNLFWLKNGFSEPRTWKVLQRPIPGELGPSAGEKKTTC